MPNGAMNIRSILGLGAPEQALTKTIRVRVQDKTVEDLDNIEVFLRYHGHQDVSRSDLVRSAIESYIEGIREEAPDVFHDSAAAARN